MYKRKGSRQTGGRKKGWKMGMALVVFLMTLVTGVYVFVEISTLAAPEKASVLAREKEAQEDTKEQEMSENEIIPEKTAEVNNEQEKEEQEPPLIVVDAGHGGEDSGCVGYGVYEKDINLQIAMRVKRRLEEQGFRVMMPRETDEFLSVEERVELANSYQADAYVSIHQNTYEGSDKSVNGIEMWYDGADGSRDSERLARLIHKETIRSTGANERVLWDIADLCVTNRTLMPACLIETGFLTNKEECRRLSAAEYQEKIAEGIVEGIELYFYSETEL